MWMLQNNDDAVEGLHYLDDFLLVGPAGQDHCQNSVRAMLALCGKLGVPVALNKLEGPASTLTFLGITLDTVNQELRLTADKLSEILQAVIKWLGRRTATKRELLSLIGKLAFAARVVPAGRLFCWRLIQLSSSVEKLHHHVYLNAEAREDLQWWHDFLPSWNGVAMFIDPVWKDADDLYHYSRIHPVHWDMAATSKGHGFEEIGTQVKCYHRGTFNGRNYCHCSSSNDLGLQASQPPDHLPLR